MSSPSPPAPPLSSVERVKARESFEPDEPLPAFTLYSASLGFEAVFTRQ